MSKNTNDDTIEIPAVAQAYFVGGGLASLAGAAYLIRDCGFEGSNIHIIEALPKLGGSNDGCGNKEEGFLVRGGRMLNDETYENLWDLLSSVKSIEDNTKTVRDEIIEFDTAHPTKSQARLVDANGNIVNSRKLGFNMRDRMDLLKLMYTDETKLDNLRIDQYFSKHFFETNFWYMWATTFAFQKHSSLFELRRYMRRMLLEYSRIHTLEGVTRTKYNQYESIILPLYEHLKKYNVDFSIKKTVVDVDFKKNLLKEKIDENVEDGEFAATAIHCLDADGKESIINLRENDLCFVTNGCMTDNSIIGSMDKPTGFNTDMGPSGKLWRKIAQKFPSGIMGNPLPFFGNAEEASWESFTATCKGNKFLSLVEKFSGNVPGSGALMTFKDSNWLMSTVIAAQPHFRNQPKDTTIFWGYSLYTDRIGNYIKKPMRECTGKEILEELLYHCRKFISEADKAEILRTTNLIPCMLPFTDAQFQPRAMKDRPEVIPKGSRNFAMISQFVEIPLDMVFTEEYSVRAARIAAYGLTKTEKEVAPVTRYDKKLSVLTKALFTSFR